MAENPRELIRAAQSAELRGDVTRAVECLLKAAAHYRNAGNAPRALQLLRHARRLDTSRLDILEEVNRLEGMPDTTLATEDEDSQLADALVRSVEEVPLPELSRRQRLIEEALRDVEAQPSTKSPELAAWVLDTEVSEDLQRLEAQLARVAASVEPGPSEGQRPSVLREVPPFSASEFVRAERPRGAVDEQLFESAWRPGALEGEESFGGDLVLAPTGQADASEPGAEASATNVSEEATPRRRRGPRIIERGPTRADVALEAWCSFCCRPRAEVGDLVAGPAGAFICKACLTESASLLGDVSPVPRPMEQPRSPVRSEPAVEFVEQLDVRGALERALQSGTRCILLVGAEGWGKSILLETLQRQGRGAITPVASLAEAALASPVFIEDVERLGAEEASVLSTFLVRVVRPCVVLSARGLTAEPGKLLLRGGEEHLAVPTTEALSRTVRGLIPVSILEHVQVLLCLRQPTREDYVEMARARLSLREPKTVLSDSVLTAFATEAERSPRAGHELRALLQRVPPGTWELENVTKPTPPRKGRRKGTS
ncbi:ClpX C4-type zinc finger protein [Corallococcus terminator]